MIMESMLRFGKSGVVRAVNEKIQEGRMRMVGITIERWPSFKCEVL